MEERALFLKSELLKALAQPTRLKILDAPSRRGKMYLRNHPGYKWGTIKYIPPHFS